MRFHARRRPATGSRRTRDKAWAEKFFLTFIPVSFVYNIVMQKMGWLSTGNFWKITRAS